MASRPSCPTPSAIFHDCLLFIPTPSPVSCSPLAIGAHSPRILIPPLLGIISFFCPYFFRFPVISFYFLLCVPLAYPSMSPRAPCRNQRMFPVLFLVSRYPTFFFSYHKRYWRGRTPSPGYTPVPAMPPGVFPSIIFAKEGIQSPFGFRLPKCLSLLKPRCSLGLKILSHRFYTSGDVTSFSLFSGPLFPFTNPPREFLCPLATFPATALLLLPVTFQAPTVKSTLSGTTALGIQFSLVRKGLPFFSLVYAPPLAPPPPYDPHLTCRVLTLTLCFLPQSLGVPLIYRGFTPPCTVPCSFLA